MTDCVQINEKWAYCQHCMTRQDFELVNGRWLCKLCGFPLEQQSIGCVIATYS